MRRRVKKDGVTVHAIAGTNVVLLGLDATKKAARGLLGFRIQRYEPATKRGTWLRGGRHFEDVPVAKRAKQDSRHAPIQAFLWGDYTADPDTMYTYTITPMYGAPDALKTGARVTVRIRTESESDNEHAVYFNRGVAGSQAYSSRFGKYRRWYPEARGDRIAWRDYVKPQDAPAQSAWKWLSRGLEEALLHYIARADGPRYSLRAAVYEFNYPPVLQAFVDAVERGVDVKIVHHAKQTRAVQLARSKGETVTVRDAATGKESTLRGLEVVRKQTGDEVCKATEAAMDAIGVRKTQAIEARSEMLIPRTQTQISHNKFIVLLEDGVPIKVWTGSTNFTAGGIFGQSNVGHVVRDEDVAQRYLDYWEALAADPRRKDMQAWNVAQQPDLEGAPQINSITPIFSPRPSVAMLEWYADRLAAAESSVHFTAAFGVSKEIEAKLVKGKRAPNNEGYLRYVMMEGLRDTRTRENKRRIAKCNQNRIAWGETRRKKRGEQGTLEESLTGLNDHVEFLHTKFMLIDPLTDDPITIAGSANFSDPSTTKNDENMLVIRGNTRIADIYLGEFMRMFNHFHRRNIDNARTKESYLAAGDGWIAPYYKAGTQEWNERLLFR